MTVLAIDPGSEQSAWVIYDGERVKWHGKETNDALLERLYQLRTGDVDRIVLEQIASYGMAVGAEVFETCVWTGRFLEASPESTMPHREPRRTVKMHLCGSMRAKDSNIRQALIDRFGGRQKAIGTTKARGPLFGIKADEWAALALAVTFCDTQTTVGA